MRGTKKRVNVTIPENYYEQVTAKNLNLSGLLSDLLGDHLAESKITIEVREETKHLYDRVIANTGFSDTDIEEHLRPVLEKLLEKKINQLEELRKAIVTPEG